MATLRFQNGARSGEIVQLPANETIIGRNVQQCSLTIDDDSISRTHARVFKDQGHFYVQDLGSLNGTFVNDARIEGSCRLFNRDVLRLNLTQFLFEGGENRPDGFEYDLTTSSASPTILLSLDPGDAEHRVGEVAEAKVRAILEITRTLGASLNADEIVNRLVNAISRVFPQAQGVYALLADRPGGELQMRARYSSIADAGESLTSGPFSLSLVKEVAESGRAILSSDHSSDTRERAGDSIHEEEPQSVMGAPFMGDGDAVLGVIQVAAGSDHSFQPTDLDVLAIAALLAGRAVEHGRLHEAFLQVERLSAIGEMMTGLAHESRNALQRSQSSLERLKIRSHNDEHSLDLIERAQTAQDELHELYERVRAYAAPIQLKHELHDLGELLMQAWENLETERVGRAIDFDPGFGADFDRRAQVDALVMLRVFGNLLSNALAAADDPVKLQVSWRNAAVDDRPALEIEIGDNGPGLPVELYQQIFVPFFTTKQSGTGLGLALVKRYVESHGGWVAPDKSDLGGASFRLVLPRAQATRN